MEEVNSFLFNNRIPEDLMVGFEQECQATFRFAFRFVGADV